MKTRVAVMVLVCGLGLTTSAEQRFLVPIYVPAPMPGAFGSRWESTFTVLNTGAEIAYIDNYGSCRIGAPCIIPIYPKTTYTGDAISGGFADSIPAAIVFVDDQYADQLEFQARVRDVSRSAESAGVWVPVLHESEMVRGPVTLLDVPTTAGFRSTLRIYSLDHAPGRSVRVSVYGVVPPDPQDPDPPTPPDRLLAEFSVPLYYSPGFSGIPLYAQTDLVSLPGVAGYDNAWVSIEPEGEFGVWALISITNNSTQEVTAVFPNRDH